MAKKKNKRARPKFLTTTYSAYFHSEVAQEDEELTHVGPRTPGGEYLRRFWHPVAFSSDLAELPIRLRILGEDLVLFRDRQGRVGLLELHCAHRGTSLEFGLVSDRGIRCCYHGWLYDVEGRILEMPGEPPGSTLNARLCHGAYPTREYKGLIFTYMGPPTECPPFPILDTFELPGYRLSLWPKYFWPCNWLQINDNNVDPVHTVFLHTRVSGPQFAKEFGELPHMEWQETGIGLIYIAARRLGDYVWVRINDTIFPATHQPPPEVEFTATEQVFTRPLMTIWRVPVDNTNTMSIGFMRVPESTPLDVEEQIRAATAATQLPGRPYEERQRQPGDYEAHTGARAIAVHGLEHLATTDRGVIVMRRLLRDAIRSVKAGQRVEAIARKEGEVVRTLAQNTVVRVPPAETPEADRALLREIGRKVAAGHYAAHLLKSS